METNLLAEQGNTAQEAAPGVFWLPVLIANVCFISSHGREWILVDTGLANSAERILQAAEKCFGSARPPKAIILTHGHFDHVGDVTKLADYWKIPVYAHELEMPYLTGQADYPPPDPTVGGGLMARIAHLYPHGSINLGSRIHPLPSDGSIPSMLEWRWIHTPGHTKGHISLFRDSDKVLVAGDAFITVNQESALDVLTQDKEVNGPPAYFTTDWQTAWKSVEKLEALKPSVVITGHGVPLQGEQLTEQLAALARDFDRLAIPEQGRYTP